MIILPSFGNHDPFPSNQMPSNDLHYYNSILNVSHWTKLLPKTAIETFRKGKLFLIILLQVLDSSLSSFVIYLNKTSVLLLEKTFLIKRKLRGYKNFAFIQSIVFFLNVRKAVYLYLIIQFFRKQLLLKTLKMAE